MTIVVTEEEIDGETRTTVESSASNEQLLQHLQNLQRQIQASSNHRSDDGLHSTPTLHQLTSNQPSNDTENRKNFNETPTKNDGDSTLHQLTSDRSRNIPESPIDRIGTKNAVDPSVDPYRNNDQALPTSNILEKGHIYFFYRPKIDSIEAKSFDDVQSMFFVLSRFDDPLFRLIRIGKKKMPSTHSRDRFWGVIEEVSTDLNTIRNILSSEQYETITRGQRTNQAARPIGQGLYAFVESHRTSHLAYVLEIPNEIGKVQQVFNLEKEGSFYFVAKNPRTSNSTAQSEYHLELPSELQKCFGNGNTWATYMPLQLMEHKGLEIIMIGESDDLRKEFGETGQQLELEEALESRQLNNDSLFQELKLNRREFPSEPLLSGDWK